MGKARKPDWVPSLDIPDRLRHVIEFLETHSGVSPDDPDLLEFKGILLRRIAVLEAAQNKLQAMEKDSIPEVLPTSPLSLTCPKCGVGRGKDCMTRKGGHAAPHLHRIRAAAAMDARGVRKTAKSAGSTIRKHD